MYVKSYVTLSKFQLLLMIRVWKNVILKKYIFSFYFFMLLLLHRTLRLRSCRNFQGFALIQAVLCKLWFLHERMYVLEPFTQTKVHHLHMVVSVFLAVLQTKHGHWVWAWGFVIYFTIFSNIEHFFLHQLVYLWVHTSRVQLGTRTTNFNNFA